MPATHSADSTKREHLSVILPTYNERDNILPLLKELLALAQPYELELLVVDDDSSDGTTELVRELAHHDSRVRLIRRLGRYGLASAIKEGLLAATGDLAAVMDSDGQHEPAAIIEAVDKLRQNQLDLVAGSRFMSGAVIKGLSQRRTGGSSIANRLARFSLPNSYSHLTDYMSGCLVLNLQSCLPYVYQVDVNGFKFLYELLAVSRGHLRVEEVPLMFQPRSKGNSKLDLAVLWDFLISLLHSLSLRLLPRRAISFALVGASGVMVQLITTAILMGLGQLQFEEALPAAVVTAATSNYLINNALTFRAQRLRGLNLLRGLVKFLLVASLPVLANVGLATTFYKFVAPNTLGAQMAGILVVFVWNYAASSRFVWNTP